jgi:hypothetical protein
MYPCKVKVSGMENRYAVGTVVYAKVSPARKLLVRRYVDKIYYCQVQADLKQKDLVYFERELMKDAQRN